MKINNIGATLFMALFLHAAGAQNLVTSIPSTQVASGKIDTIITTVDAAKDLKHFTITENDIVQQDGYLSHGKKTGKWMVYYPNGVLLSVCEYDNGMRNGLYIECEKNGAVLVQEYYKNDKLDGEQKKYATSKNVRIVKSIYYFRDGVYNGICTDFTDMGYKQAQVEYLNGKKNGTSKWFFTSGSLAMEQIYIEDVLSGTQKVYNPQGVVISSGDYANNMKSGTWSEYFDSGKLKSQGNYTNDAKSGTWKYYDESGNVTRTENF